MHNGNVQASYFHLAYCAQGHDDDAIDSSSLQLILLIFVQNTLKVSNAMFVFNSISLHVDRKWNSSSHSYSICSRLLEARAHKHFKVDLDNNSSAT